MGRVEWFKLSKHRNSVQPKLANQAGTPEAEPEKLAWEEPEQAPMLPGSSVTMPITIDALAAMPLAILSKSPKATFDNPANEPKTIQPVPTPPPAAPRAGFRISASREGESNEVQLASPTLTVAKARVLFKSGWHVHITNAAGRQFAPPEFDEVLKFD